MNAEVVAFGVFEPGRLLSTEHADMIHGFEPREVVILEHHT